MNNIDPVLELSPLEQIADHLRAMRPEMKRMAGNEHDILDEAISLANQLSIRVMRLAKQYPDNANLNEARKMQCLI